MLKGIREYCTDFMNTIYAEGLRIRHTRQIRQLYSAAGVGLVITALCRQVKQSDTCKYVLNF